MYYIEKVQAQGLKQRKVSLSKKFWNEFPLDCFVKIELLESPNIFFVDRVQAQGKLQRRIPVPQKFWEDFDVESIVKVTFLRRGKGQWDLKKPFQK